MWAFICPFKVYSFETAKSLKFLSSDVRAITEVPDQVESIEIQSECVLKECFNCFCHKSFLSFEIQKSVCSTDL